MGKILSKRQRIIDIMTSLGIEQSPYLIDIYENFVNDLIVPKSKWQNIWKNTITNFIKYGVTDMLCERYYEIDRMGPKITSVKMNLMYGSHHGKIRWGDYCQFQSKKNTKDYKIKNKNMMSEEIDEYNRSRSVTLENCITRHGFDEGTRVFQTYRARQKDAGCSLEYFIGKHGELEGTLKYYEVNEKKALSLDNFVRKYGVEVGQVKYDTLMDKRAKHIFHSKLSQEFIREVETHHNLETYYATHKNGKGEYNAWSPMYKRTFFYDYVLPDIKLCVEFNGDLFHANPAIYMPTDIPKFRGNKKQAFEFWQIDKFKIQSLFDNRGFHAIIVWESEYRAGPEKTIERVVNEIYKRIRDRESR